MLKLADRPSEGRAFQTVFECDLEGHFASGDGAGGDGQTFLGHPLHQVREPEAFLTEDADLLIENTETGATLARHNLKIIDTLFESTACLIGGKRAASPTKKKRMELITKTLGRAAEEIS